MNLLHRLAARRLARQVATQPPLPENVRVVLDDGTVVPVELRYLGWIDEVHQWVASASVDIGQHGFKVAADLIPAATSITLQLHGTMDLT